MRFLLPGLLAVLLAVTIPLALTGGASAEASPMTLASEITASPPAHDCCTPQPEYRHGDCAACATVGQPAIGPATIRLPRDIRHHPTSRNMESATIPLLLPPPGSATT